MTHSGKGQMCSVVFYDLSEEEQKIVASLGETRKSAKSILVEADSSRKEDDCPIV